jgi:hypothetical protein
LRQQGHGCEPAEDDREGGRSGFHGLESEA